jgi:hypothetical protein
MAGSCKDDVLILRQRYSASNSTTIPRVFTIRDTFAGMATDSLTDQYSIIVWLAAVLVGLLTIPVGLLIPAYFYLKADRGEASQQSTLEIWTVILVGIFGIAAVELGGRKGAKILWGIVVALFVLSIGGIAAVALL